MTVIDMESKRKVTKKKTAKTSAASKSTATRRAAGGAQKKKGVAPKRNAASASGVLSLGQSIVISEVMERREQMLAAVAGRNEIRLDGKQIEHIDGTGLQLLVSLIKEAVNGNVQISWVEASDVLRNNAAQLGLTEILALDKLPGEN